MKKIPAYTFIGLLLAVNFFFAQCAKEYSYEGGIIDSPNVVNPPPGIPVSSYFITGSPGSCFDPAIRGEYFSGKKLTSANFLEINVEVASTGSYLIQTDTVDGISFYAKGVFIKTGQQKVVLAGSGTPKLSRKLTYTVIGENSYCQFPLEVLTPGYPASYVLESGFDASCTGHVVKGNYQKAIPLTNGNTVSVRVYVSIPGVYTLATQTVNGTSFAFTGEFKQAGVDYVELQGSGIPQNAGIYSYHLQIVGPAPLGGAGCNFDIKVN